jgi:hypothetical protein
MDRRRVVSLYTESQMAPYLNINLISDTNIWYIAFRFYNFDFFQKKSVGGGGEKRRVASLTPHSLLAPMYTKTAGILSTGCRGEYMEHKEGK